MLHALLAVDLRLFSLVNGSHDGALDAFFRAFTWLGNGWVVFPLLALAVALRTPRGKRGAVALACVLSLAANGIFLRIIKTTVNRPRPSAYFQTHDAAGAPGSAAIHAVPPVLKKRSFPSGHANTAFTVAALLSFLFGGWFWLSFGAAALVGYSRVYLGDHFPLDVAGGALLAVVLVWGVLKARRLPAN